MIIKNKSRKNPFTSVPNSTLNDDRLKADDLGVLVYLASKPEDWEVRSTDIRKRFGLGREKLQSIFKRLVEHGYAQLQKGGVGGGGGYHIDVYGGYISTDGFCDSREKRQSRKATVEKPVTIQRKNIYKERIDTNKDDDKGFEEVSHVNDQDLRVNQPAPYPSSADWFEVSKKDKNWKEVTCKTSYINKRNLTGQEFDLLLPHFYTIRKSQGVKWKSERDFKSHFNNWLRTAPIWETLQMLKPAAKNERPPIEDITESQRGEAVEFAKAMLADKKRTIY